MKAIPWMLSLSFVGSSSLGCSHQEPIEPDAGGLQPADPASATSELQSTSHLTRHLYVLNEAPSCATTLAGFFQCVLGQTNWNSLVTNQTGSGSALPSFNHDDQCL